MPMGTRSPQALRIHSFGIMFEGCTPSIPGAQTGLDSTIQLWGTAATQMLWEKAWGNSSSSCPKQIQESLGFFGEELERNVGIALYITQFTMGYSYKAKTVCPHKHLKRWFAEKHPTSTSHSPACTEEIWFICEGALKSHSGNGCAQPDPFCPPTEAKGSAGTTDVLVTPPWEAAAATLAR